MKRLLFVLFLLPVQFSFGQHPVILSEDAQTLGAFRVDVGAGAEFYNKVESMTPADPKTELRAGILSARFGVAPNVNFDVEWKGGLFATMRRGDREFEWGDLVVATKINVFDEQGDAPSVGIRSSVKLPNTPYLPNKLGNDFTDYYFHVLGTKSIGGAELRFNGGLGIVGNPRGGTRQIDIYMGSVAAILSLGDHRAFVELYGFTGPIADADKLLARVGFMVNAAGLQWNVFSSARIGGNRVDIGSAFEASQDWSVGMFASKVIDL
jgi:hypothetical protein